MGDRVISEAESVEYVKKLYRIEQDPGHDQAAVLMGPFTAFTVIGALQLAMRYPEFSPDQARLVQSFIDQCKPLFAGTPGEQPSRRAGKSPRCWPGNRSAAVPSSMT